MNVHPFEKMFRKVYCVHVFIIFPQVVKTHKWFKPGDKKPSLHVDMEVNS